MNHQNRKMISALAFAGLLFGASVPAQAADHLAGRAASSFGHMIAAQGNAALATIRDEIKDTVMDTLKPFLPADPKSAGQPTNDSSQGKPAV